MNLCRLPVSDRRARARAAPLLHGHDRRRVRAAGRHAGVGRPQRRRHRQGQARRAHLRAGPPAASCASTRTAKGMRVADLKKGWGSAQAGHFKAIFARGRRARRLRRQVLRGPARRGRAAQQDQPAAEVVPGHLPRLPRPRPRGDAAPTSPEPARVVKKRFGRSSDERRRRVLADAERALSRIFNYDSQAIVEAFYYDTFASMGVNLKIDGRGRPGPRHLRPVRHRAQHDARDAADASAPRRFEVQDMCSA